jgi:glycosyltransferase involved in cell wall biosynthesis
VKGNSLLISTCGEKINSLADLTYINGIPLRCSPILSNVSAKRKCYGRAYDICARTSAAFMIYINSCARFKSSDYTLKVLVVHVSLNSAGGGERICLSVIKALHRGGNWVKLATVDKTDWHRLKMIFGEIAAPDDESYIFSILPKMPSNILGSALLTSFFWAELFFCKFAGGYDLIINTCGEKMDSIADVTFFSGIPLRSASFLEETAVKRKCISIFYDRILRIFDKANNSLMVAQGQFHKTLIQKCTEKKMLIMNPPVNTGKFRHLATRRRNENIVVTFSQYFPIKNLTLIPRIAKIVKNGNFVIVGPSSAASNETIEELQRLIAALSVEDRVELLTNQPFSKLLEFLSRGKVFLRVLNHEPFGIAVVEAMAAGCVPVVPRDGGPWYDILGQEQGKYGYSYATIEEAAQYIEMLLTNEPLRMEISKRAQKRSPDFDGALFEKRVQGLVGNMLARKSPSCARRNGF